MKRLLTLSTCIAAFCAMAHSASASITIYTDQSSFDTATQTTSYIFPDMGSNVSAAPSYTEASVTFTSGGLTFFDDAYNTPYIADDTFSVPGPTFTITSTTSSLGLTLGSYFGGAFYDYTADGVSGTVDVPFRNDPNLAFLGLVASSGPVSVTFGVPAGDELDVPTFQAGAAGDVSSAPEPSTWALMFAGAGLMGAVLRRRHRLVVVPTAA